MNRKQYKNLFRSEFGIALNTEVVHNPKAVSVIKVLRLSLNMAVSAFRVFKGASDNYFLANVAVKVVPSPELLCTVSFPLMFRTICCAMERPSP